MIFIAEGDSAVGPMISARNPLTQAIFPLKGKPLNCYGKKRDLVISNDEFYCLMKALNIESAHQVEDLRYNKIIIATDADDDGMHIRNLLLTFFLYYFKDLVQRNHLYVLETPLYRVRNKEKTIYCYDDDERDDAIEEIGRGWELTRFKGLGEIDPREFGQFIGEDMRLIPVEIEKNSESEAGYWYKVYQQTGSKETLLFYHLKTGQIPQEDLGPESDFDDANPPDTTGDDDQTAGKNGVVARAFRPAGVLHP